LRQYHAALHAAGYFAHALSCGFGWLAVAGLAQRVALAQASPLDPKATHFPARAKRVIFLTMREGPSHVDTFDYKPKLTADSDKPGNRPGTENENLPGFVTLSPPSDVGGALNYGSAFRPATYQATRIGPGQRPIASAVVRNLESKRLADEQRAAVDFVQETNHETLARDVVNPEVEGVVASYELAFRMQMQMPGVLDLSSETAATKALYGISGDSGTRVGRDGHGREGRFNSSPDDFGRKCLLACRLIEAGVRFVEVAGGNWDQHFNLSAGHEANAAAVDQPIAGLLTDLKQRGLLKDTLVVCTSEFGRTPHAQGGDGRDHNHKAFTLCCRSKSYTRCSRATCRTSSAESL
jgi:Protein of unknown function (DUF1501)